MIDGKRAPRPLVFTPVAIANGQPMRQIIAVACAVVAWFVFGNVWGLVVQSIFGRRGLREERIIGTIVWAVAMAAGVFVYLDLRSPHRPRVFGLLILGSVLGAWLAWPGDFNEAQQDAARYWAPILAAAYDVFTLPPVILKAYYIH